MSSPWAVWTPVLEAADGRLDLGRGAEASGTSTQLGRTVLAEFHIRFGEGGDAGAGHFLLTPPVEPRPIDDRPRRVGSGQLGDHSDGVRHLQVAITANSVIDERRFLLSTDGRPSTGRLIVGAAWPWIWARDDFLVGQLAYEAAADPP